MKHMGTAATRLTLLLLLIVWTAAPALARTPELRSLDGRQDGAHKISPVLAAEVRMLMARPDYDYPIPLIVQVDPEEFARDEAERGRPRPNALGVIHGYRAKLRASQIPELLKSERVRYVTLDAPIRPMGKGNKGGGGGDEGGTGETGSVDLNLRIVGADQARKLGYQGTGVGIAVFDSGVRDHADFPGLAAAVDFTTGIPIEVNTKQSSGLDAYGHGTHVAGIVYGSGGRSGGTIQGVAPTANLIDIKVVGDDGTGLTSNLIAAIDWLISNRQKYNVRVANMSLGHPPIESYINDPLCHAVRRLVESGIVTVTSAGNSGKDADGVKIWGAISSPGNEPSVITVGALNHNGTLTHADDVATSYSSRGPTYLDNLFKPDLVAPGNKIASALAKFSVLHLDYQDLQINEHYIYLSGSSMAAAYVSGTAALMLQANPELTPRLVKAILMLSAVKLDQPHRLEQGNGLLNAYTAVLLSEAVNVPEQRLDANVDPTWYLEGEAVVAGGALAFADKVVYSPLVSGSYQGDFWGDGFYWTDAQVTWNSSVFWADAIFFEASDLWQPNSVVPDAFLWVDGFIWSDDSLLLDGFYWTDSLLESNAFMWADSVFWADTYIYGEANLDHDFRGDN